MTEKCEISSNSDNKTRHAFKFFSQRTEHPDPKFIEYRGNRKLLHEYRNEKLRNCEILKCNLCPAGASKIRETRAAHEKSIDVKCGKVSAESSENP